MRHRTVRLGMRGTLAAVALVVGCAGSSKSTGDCSDTSHGTGAGSLGPSSSDSSSSGRSGNNAGSPGLGRGGSGGSASSGVSGDATNGTAAGGLAGRASGGRTGGNETAGTAAVIASAGGGAGGHGNASAAGMGGTAGATSTAGSSSDDSSTGGEPEITRPATWDTIKLVLTGTRPPCNSSICHGGNGKVSLGFPVNNDDQLYAVLTQYVAPDCDKMVLVVPGHPEESALVKVIKGPCSDQVPRMPDGCTEADGNCVPDDYIAAVEQWIANGAVRP